MNDPYSAVAFGAGGRVAFIMPRSQFGIWVKENEAKYPSTINDGVHFEASGSIPYYVMTTGTVIAALAEFNRTRRGPGRPPDPLPHSQFGSDNGW